VNLPGLPGTSVWSRCRAEVVSEGVGVVVDDEHAETGHPVWVKHPAVTLRSRIAITVH
jgi:hypothetical protein